MDGASTHENSLTRDQKAEQLARNILTLARNTLLVEFRFLSRAISQIQMAPAEKVWFGCDGTYLYFEPWYVLGQYKAEQTLLTRDLMHAILHHIFSHAFVGKEIDRTRWDFACDVAVEAIIHDLSSPSLQARRESKQLAFFSLLQEELGQRGLTAERIYHWLDTRDISQEEILAKRQHFLGDEHGLWYGSAGDRADVDPNLNLKQIWEDVARRMQTELETIQQEDSALVQALRRLNRPRVDYTAFLQRFGVHGEVLRLSDDEFDYNYYSYGMELYGNIPLIEPLEYREQRRIRDFVIAIDTSGSVRGDMVQSYIEHTQKILMQQENFFTQIHLHIIQCDDRIREDAMITCKEDFDQYLQNLELKGFGRTDFRPVFSYVEDLLRKKELTDLRGLLYFSDGDGIFPAEKPPYDTAFILYETDYEPKIPTWAISLILTEDEILERNFGSTR
ncbi:MAG: hypothetical protein IKU83_05830 [Lachnospiraceae bacterium]|nr:hypothetical protein [Lachnospiraceae bacterium]